MSAIAGMDGEVKGMDYFNAMWRVLRIEEAIYQDISSRGLSIRYSTINVFILGLLYGLLSLSFLSVELFREFPDAASVFTAKVIVVATGIFVAFLLHLGASFLIWTFCRAMGGEIRFIPTYFNLGVAVVPMWLAVPGLVALRAGWSAPLIAVYTMITGVYAFSSIFIAAKSTFGYSYKKMCIAMAMMLIFTVSFLALWLG